MSHEEPTTSEMKTPKDSKVKQDVPKPVDMVAVMPTSIPAPVASGMKTPVALLPTGEPKETDGTPASSSLVASSKGPILPPSVSDAGNEIVDLHTPSGKNT